ncbi:MAG: NAD-dependent epimerase/dehydratase family protein [Spirochaetes bacterium]|nr:MAG: NAD-dependent epimerase/dehydratase family protein [Spirochaetota bacterium]
MIIAVFGSTGTTGRELITQALERGHHIRAFARTPGKLSDLRHEGLEIIPGELSDRESIVRTIINTDAVISLLGPRDNSRDRSLSNGMQFIVDAMTRAGNRRIVSISTASVRDDQDQFDMPYFLLVGIVKHAFNHAYGEIIAMSDIIRSSGLDWTLVRVGLLNNEQMKQIKVGYHGKRSIMIPIFRSIRTGFYGHHQVGIQVSRVSVAKFILDQITSKKYLRQAPAISD